MTLKAGQGHHNWFQSAVEVGSAETNSTAVYTTHGATYYSSGSNLYVKINPPPIPPQK